MRGGGGSEPRRLYKRMKANSETVEKEVEGETSKNGIKLLSLNACKQSFQSSIF